MAFPVLTSCLFWLKKARCHYPLFTMRFFIGALLVWASSAFTLSSVQRAGVYTKSRGGGVSPRAPKSSSLAATETLGIVGGGTGELSIFHIQ